MNQKTTITQEKEMIKRNPVITIASTSKYAKDSAFLCFLEQKFNRNCYRVVDRTDVEPKRLVDTWAEYIGLYDEQDDLQSAKSRFDNNSDLQGLLSFGNCVNKFHGVSVYE
jgi:hypothetical protein